MVGRGVRKQMTRDERREMILDTLRKSSGPMTTHELAVAIGLKPSPYTRSLIYGLWHDGVITVLHGTGRTGHEAFFWSVTR